MALVNLEKLMYKLVIQEFTTYYSLDECLMLCRMRSMIKYCGCVNPPWPSDLINGSICNLLDLPCLTRWKSVWYGWKSFDYVNKQQNSKELFEFENCGFCLPTCSGVKFKISVNDLPLRNVISNSGDYYSHGILEGLTNDQPLAVIKLFFAKRYAQATETTVVSDWIGMAKQILAADYGSDLSSVKEELDSQQHEHKIIDKFHSKIIYDAKCLRFVDWLIEARPSFSPPRRDLRPPDSDPGATQYYSHRLDALNIKYDRLLEQLSQRLKTAIEVNGSDGLLVFRPTVMTGILAKLSKDLYTHTQSPRAPELSSVPTTIGESQQYNCVTPDNYYGYCVLLSYCPQIANIFQTTNRRVAEQYIIGLQRSCGTRNVNGDPVVCCTRPQQQQQQQQQNIRTTPNPVTQPTNPFFPTGRPITQAPITQAPITQPPTTTTTTTPQPITSAPLIEPKGTYCRGPDIREGSCIDLKNCQELVNELYAKQNDQTFANFLRASNRICGATGSIVCCPTGTSQQLTTTATPRVNSNEIPTRLPTVTEGCGYTASSYKKIVGGEVSKKGAWPWIALLGYNDELSSSPFKCGGTLITARHVITAAHCIRSDLSFVRLGEHDLSTDTETKHVDIPIVKQVVNTDYNKRNGHSDIALLYLERNVE
ncbi:uncharacterized protein LOC119688867, partial [Teleopsis dalmanni]|uniref:uncharacterized protein LOC119688867 n=1 Tax=Teleopsis dalmanni TaxID=139649 RepID=UPI0018CF9DD9